jgi:hypothetical protein
VHACSTRHTNARVFNSLLFQVAGKRGESVTICVGMAAPGNSICRRLLSHLPRGHRRNIVASQKNLCSRVDISATRAAQAVRKSLGLASALGESVYLDQDRFSHKKV